MINRLDSTDPEFSLNLQQLVQRNDEEDETLNSAVSSILSDVKINGDNAVIEYTNRFDHRNVKNFSELKVEKEDLEKAVAMVPVEIYQNLEVSATRIEIYHRNQLQQDWQFQDSDGNTLGQKITPLERVGVYVPGGKAAYPSSVLMNVIPARVAGVKEVIMVVPAPEDNLNPLILAAAYIVGVDRIFTIGGAQAIAALAYGTGSVPQVDKITGPGNRFVAEAKRMVYGVVGIDMIAGPSEVVIISDGDCDPDWLAMDLFAQAEHDEEACAILISPDIEFLDRVAASIEKLLPEMERAGIIGTALSNHGALVKVSDMSQALALVNNIAPEHLELAVRDPKMLLPEINNAGAIFMGPYSAEVLGDYCIGPNHVLPTSRTARFSSPLGVYDFQKRTSIIMCNENSAANAARISSVLAHGEGLTAHARSAEYRIK